MSRQPPVYTLLSAVHKHHEWFTFSDNCKVTQWRWVSWTSATLSLHLSLFLFFSWLCTPCVVLAVRMTRCDENAGRKMSTFVALVIDCVIPPISISSGLCHVTPQWVDSGDVRRSHHSDNLVSSTARQYVEGMKNSYDSERCWHEIHIHRPRTLYLAEMALRTPEWMRRLNTVFFISVLLFFASSLLLSLFSDLSRVSPIFALLHTQFYGCYILFYQRYYYDQIVEHSCINSIMKKKIRNVWLSIYNLSGVWWRWRRRWRRRWPRWVLLHFSVFLAYFHAHGENKFVQINELNESVLHHIYIN